MTFATVEPEDFVICRNQKIVRTVRVVKREDACDTIYTKSGVDQDVGGGKHYQSCTRILDNIRGNLEKAGWRCREVDEAYVTHSAQPQ